VRFFLFLTPRRQEKLSESLRLGVEKSNHGRRQQPRSCPANSARREKTDNVQQKTEVAQDLKLLADFVADMPARPV
jgi:hypothetical protein